MTKTNEEALQVTGLLIKKGIHAKLIQTNDYFNLYNLLEVRYFINGLKFNDEISIISEEVWEEAKRSLENKFKQSTKIEICRNLIKDFEEVNPKIKFKSDFEIFVKESKLEDFITGNGETIFVSTIHKAKGKEFDNVFLLLDNYNLTYDDDLRKLYVAMTRAKRNLTVHYNSNYLNNIKVNNLHIVEDKLPYSFPNQLSMHLTYHDIWLDYFISRQYLIKNLKSGDRLIIKGDEITDSSGKPLIKFSNNFLKVFEGKNQQGYKLKEVIVNYIVYWKKEGTEEEIRIILPELNFEKTSN